MSDPNAVRAKILRNFNDDGTQRRFTANEVVPLDAGTFANYRAGGLVEAAPDEVPAQTPVSDASAGEVSAAPKTGRSRT